MLFKSIQSIISSSSSAKIQVDTNSTSSLQSSNGIALLDNLTLLSNNRNNQTAILGVIKD